MTHDAFVAVYLLVMVALIVGLDAAFLRDRFRWRLVVNIVIVGVFLAAYILFFRTGA